MFKHSNLYNPINPCTSMFLNLVVAQVRVPPWVLIPQFMRFLHQRIPETSFHFPGHFTINEKLISGSNKGLENFQFSSVAQSCLTLFDPMDCGAPGFPVHHQLPELAQTHVHWVSNAVQPFHPLSSPSPPAFNLSEHQGLFQWVSSSHQVAKVLEFQLQHFNFIWAKFEDYN